MSVFHAKRRRRVQLLAIASLFIIAASLLIGFGFRDGISYFRSPSEVLADAPDGAEIFRLGGLVVEGSLVQTDQGYQFDVTDGAATLPVRYEIRHGPLPDLFSEGTGMIALGALRGSVFEAREILAKHDEQYMPREVAEALERQHEYASPKDGQEE